MPNSIETKTVILEDPLPEEKQQEVFNLSSEEEKEKLQLHTKFEANKLSDAEIKLITGNGELTVLTISRPRRASIYRTWKKINVQRKTGRIRANIAQWKLSLRVVIISTHCSKNELYYYDSLFHDKISKNVKMQICSIFKCCGKELTVNVKACQQQTNAVDCRVFCRCQYVSYFDRCRYR